MKRFEYNIVSLSQMPKDYFDEAEQGKTRKDVIEWMNTYGTVGWEIIDWYDSKFGIRLVLKRELA